MSLESSTLTGTIAYLVIFIAITPVVFFVLSRGASTTFNPDPSQLGEIRRLSKHLDEILQRLLQEATRSFRSAPGQRQVLDLLIQFAKQAERFHFKMANSSRPGGDSHSEFFWLQKLFEDVLANLRPLRSYPVHAELLEHLLKTMEALKFYFDSPPALDDARQPSRPLPAADPPVGRIQVEDQSPLD